MVAALCAKAAGEIGSTETMKVPESNRDPKAATHAF
jgi:hypothetical protein